MTIKEQIPLLKDHHTHPYLYASLGNCLDIRFVEDKEKALELIGCRASSDQVNVVIGWNDSLYRFSTAELDRFPALIVMNASLHSFQLNSAAREEIAPRYPEIVANLADREWIEKNAALIMGFVMGVKPCDYVTISSFYRQLAEQGVWYAEEMTLWDSAELDIFDNPRLAGRSSFWATPELFCGLDDHVDARVRGIKLFADGALGARTAGIAVPYLGGEKGILKYSDGELLELLSQAAQWGKDMAIHAIGDLAIDKVVEAISRLDRRSPVTRLEHCQFISLENARKAKELGIVLSMQPNFSLESEFYRDRLPGHYLEANNPFRMLIDQAGFVPGKDLVFGSDGMPHGAPHALESALFPPLPGQRLTLPEFVAGYCMPDFTHGFIDVSIDNESRHITTEVSLKSA
jgi:predicted amidohydrolase YtcJ